jgi:hypothetical protein
LTRLAYRQHSSIRHAPAHARRSHPP